MFSVCIVLLAPAPRFSFHPKSCGSSKLSFSPVQGTPLESLKPFHFHLFSDFLHGFSTSSKTSRSSSISGMRATYYKLDLLSLWSQISIVIFQTLIIFFIVFVVMKFAWHSVALLISCFGIVAWAILVIVISYFNCDCNL